MNDPVYPGENSGGEFLEYWLKYYKITIRDLSEMSGVEENKIKRLLENKARIIPKYVEDLFAALNLQVTVKPQETDEEYEPY